MTKDDSIAKIFLQIGNGTTTTCKHVVDPTRKCLLKYVEKKEGETHTQQNIQRESGRKTEAEREEEEE